MDALGIRFRRLGGARISDSGSCLRVCLGRTLRPMRGRIAKVKKIKKKGKYLNLNLVH
jgi:hypothetical protein